jgi:hypothetical protein
MDSTQALRNLQEIVEDEIIEYINDQIKGSANIHYLNGALYCITADFINDIETTLEQLTYDVLSMHNLRGTGKLWSEHIPEMTAFRDDMMKCVDILNKAIEEAVDDL